MKLLTVISACAAMLLLDGCAHLVGDRYSSSPDNVVALRPMANKPVNVGVFTSTKPGVKSIGCRAYGPVSVPDGVTFAQYVQKALSDELKLANAYSATAPITLTGNLDLVNFDSMDGKWFLTATVKSSNGKLLVATIMHKYPSNFTADSACEVTKDALMPSVQDLINKIATSPDWPALIAQ